MRIAIDGSAWTWTRGFGRYTRGLTRAIAGLVPPEDLLLVVDADAAGADDLPDVPRIVVRRTHGRREVPGREEWRTPLAMWRTSRALSRADAVVFPTHTGYVPVRPGRRVALVVHDAIREGDLRAARASLPADLRWRAKSWIAVRQAAVIATTTEASACALRERLPIGGRPIVVLGAGADPVFAPERAPTEEGETERWVPAGRRFLLYVGGLGRHKRVPELLHAFGRLGRRPSCADLLLVMAGSLEAPPEERGPVDRALEELGPVRSRVIRPGYVPDAALAALYRRAACVVLPSGVEGFGLPALEAMACGAPLVVSRAPSLAEVCGDAAESFGDPADLPDVLERLLADPVRRAALGRLGIARAGRFGWVAAARRLLDALAHS